MRSSLTGSRVHKSRRRMMRAPGLAPADGKSTCPTGGSGHTSYAHEHVISDKTR